MKVVILGGGFASLKIATLISHKSKKGEVNVFINHDDLYHPYPNEELD